MIALRRLHDLGQHPAHVLRMHEEDRRPVRPDPRLAEHAAALPFEPRPGRVNLGHLEAQVVLPAERIAREEAGDRRIRPQRLEQFDLAVRGIDEAHPHALRGQVERLADHLRAHRLAPERDRPVERGRGDADMVEAAEFHDPTPPSNPDMVALPSPIKLIAP